MKQLFSLTALAVVTTAAFALPTSAWAQTVGGCGTRTSASRSVTVPCSVQNPMRRRSPKVAN